MLITLATLAQKVKVKDDVATVDGKPYCKLEGINCKLGYCDYRISTLTGAEVALVKIRNYVDRDQVSSYSPTGRVVYYDWTFLASHAKAETDQGNVKSLVRAMLAANLLKDGALDPEGVRNFVAINGMRHSKRQSQLGGTTIIIQK